MATLEDGGFVEAVSSIMGAVQSGQGSPASPVAADGFRAFDIDVQNNAEVIERKEQVGVLGQPASPGVGVAYRILTFRSLLAGWGSSWGDAPPELDALLRCAKLTPTIDSTNNTYRYDPISTAEEWSTFKTYWDQVVHELTDCQANLKFSAEIGQPMVVETSLMGLWVALADDTLVAPSSLHATKAPPFKSATFTYESDAIPVSKFEFDMGNVITPLPDPGPSDGVRSFKIVNRNPTGSFDAEMTKVATKDWETLFKAGTTGALNLVLGSTTGNTITLNFGQIQILALAPAVEGEIRRVNISFGAKYSSGDDSFYLKYE